MEYLVEFTSKNSPQLVKSENGLITDNRTLKVITFFVCFVYHIIKLLLYQKYSISLCVPLYHNSIKSTNIKIKRKKN